MMVDLREDTGHGYWEARGEVLSAAGEALPWPTPVFVADDHEDLGVKPREYKIGVLKAIKAVPAGVAELVKAGLQRITAALAELKAESMHGQAMQYGISAVCGEEAVVAQMKAGHRYQNELIAIEKQRREDRNKAQLPFLRAGLDERLAEIEASIEDLQKEQRRANARVRSRAGDKKALNDALKPLKAERKELFAERKAAMKAIRESDDLQATFAEIDERAKAEEKAARAETPAFWGTYKLAENAVKAAKSKPELRFRRWDGSGSVAVQIQGGMSTEEIFGGDTRVRLEPVDRAAWDPSTPRGERKWLSKTTLSLRIGSEGRDPIWATFRLHLHRPLPPGRIKWVKVHRRMVGSGFRWLCDIVMEAQSLTEPQHRPKAALDVGWRLVPGGLRVATLSDESGNMEQLILPVEIMDRLRKVEDLQSIRKKALNARLLILKAWLDLQEDLPEWIVKDTEFLHQWKSPGRLARLCLDWCRRPFAGDDDAFYALEEWRKQDKHLWDWEANLRDKVLRRRREIYRVWAKSVCERYGTLVLEKMDLREFDRRKPVEDDDGEDVASKMYRRDAAISVLREAIANAARGRKVLIVETNPAYTTRACHSCGVVDESWDPAVDIRHRCSACGVSWDQDVNAAINLLNASGEVAPKPLESLAV